MDSSDSRKVGHVTISITGEENQAIPAPGPANPQLKFYFALLYVLAIVFMMLTQMLSAIFQNDMKSTYKTRDGFFIILAVVSLSVAILATAILIFTSHCLQGLMRDIHYTIFKFIGYFSATIASFCLTVVVFVPLDLNPWIAYPVICILFTATLFACYYLLWKYVCVFQPDDNQFQLPIHKLAGLFITLPLCITWFAFVSNGIHWIRYMVLCLNLTILVASCFFTAYMTLFYERKQLGYSSNDPTRQKDINHPMGISLAS